MKLTAKMLRELASLRSDVAERIAELKKAHCLRNVEYYIKGAGSQFWMSEGADLDFFAPNGNAMHADMVSESTVGADVGIVGNSIGYTPAIPEGTWIVESGLFMGKWYITVTYFGVSQLAG